ncbi:NAD-dependent protein deacetylase sirtuin-3 [Salvelinus namaycush]|uniref:NAD-dependent protein deacetylase sirtuin-3 n=1 Tax=Salvelinus namaycush TaxID=8040 RepID=A0A8U1FDK1_SALNM|nr:NAD-dependent protein deacetylase sirtuin-3 [Salvelinus namaycush]XP_038873700.1 NAD-dependent protein deacetylase sirtuin-3 [Salvelinus namaycush]
MSKARSSWDKRAPQGPALTRVTRSSTPQAWHTEPPQPQDSGPGPHGTQQRKQTDSALPLAQDLSQMSVSGQDTSLPRKGRVSKGSSGPIQGGLSSSGSKPTQSYPSRPAMNPSPRGGLAAVSRLVKLGRCKNVVVVAGAGISTASGIPDFRTPGTGLYANLAKYNIPYPEAIFNIEYFSNDPRPFFSLAKELYPGSHRPNYIHYFIHMLHHKGLLLRMYTQNIDGLEKISGIPDEKLVEAHGSFATSSCHLCYTSFPAQEAKSAIMSDKVPVCTFCQATVKPDIVFFGEDLPEKYFLHSKDFPKADLLIIMGTSLQIEPFASLVNTVRSTVPRLLLNRDAVGPFQKVPLRRGDYIELGDLVDTVRRFAEFLGWHSEIQDLMTSQENGTIPTLVSSVPVSNVSSGRGREGPTQIKATGLGRRGASEPRGRLPPKSRPGARGPTNGSSESDSESDSKSIVSSSPSK